jgi:hypothetical protein
MSDHPQAAIISAKIKYEWDMFQWLANRIANGWQTSDQMQRNLLLEGFLLHARVLRDFFVADPRQDDVSAKHFFDDTSIWENAAANLCPYLRQNQIRLNKLLAHLTYSRLNESKNWDPYVITNELNQACRQFYSLLSNQRQEWFQQVC